MYKKFYLSVIISIFCSLSILSAQASQLALQYYKNGEFEKAASLFSKVIEGESYNPYFWGKYIDCLIRLGQYDKAENQLKKQLETQSDLDLYVILGQVYHLKGENEKAERAYEAAIANLTANRSEVYNLASAFQKNQLLDKAIQTFKRGAELMNDEYVFAYNLAGLYQDKGDVTEMIKYFLVSLEANPNRLDNVKLMFQRYLNEKEHFVDLQNQVFQAIQNGEEGEQYPELLAWAFIQGKNYAAALRQLEALDRRNNENGRRVYSLAQTAENDEAYDVAIRAYNYIINEKGASSPYFMAAQQQILDTRLQKITDGFNYSKSELDSLYQDYEAFLDAQGRNGRTASIMADQAELAALYLNDIEAAISILENLKDAPGVNPLIQARAKMKLGDYYLIEGKRWEATLLYAQVDKAFPEAEIGEEARFRNALLSYYTGDFEWAQEQFDILKAATSRLISNDAIDRSVFIMDNLNLDTTAQPLSLYADAELLIFQNKFEKAYLKLDSLKFLYPEHGLQDDILYLKARVAEKKDQFEQAKTYYAEIVNDFPEEIRADNALYHWAELEQERFENMEKAKELYQKLFLEYANSTLAMEARKRFRQLRGDNIQ